MTPEENDLLCRVEGHAPMGQLMRRHWIAACLSEEIASRTGRRLRRACLAKISLFSATRRAGSASSASFARTGALRCSTGAMRNADCAASITAGNLTLRETSWKWPRSQPDSTFPDSREAKSLSDA